MKCNAATQPKLPADNLNLAGVTTFVHCVLMVTLVMLLLTVLPDVVQISFQRLSGHTTLVAVTGEAAQHGKYTRGFAGGLRVRAAKRFCLSQYKTECGARRTHSWPWGRSKRRQL